MHSEIAGDRPPLSSEELEGLTRIENLAAARRAPDWHGPHVEVPPVTDYGSFVETTIRERTLYRETLLVAYGRVTEAGMMDLAQYLKLVLGIDMPKGGRR